MSTPEKTPPARIRIATFEDYSGIHDILQRHGLTPKSLEEWRHLVEDNPAQKEFSNPLPMGWVIESAKGNIAGFLGNLAAVYYTGEKKWKTAIAWAWAVDQDYRSSSIFLLGKHFAQRDSDFFITTTARKESGAVFPAFRSYPIPVSSFDEPYFAVTSYSGFARSLLKKKGLPGIGVPPLALALWSWDRFRSGLKIALSPDPRVQSPERFDERFDAFWAKLRQRYPDRLLAARDARTLQWHYEYSLRKKASWLHTYEQNGEVLAYAIFFRENNSDYDLTRVRLVDLQVLADPGETHDRACAALLQAGLRRCQAERVAMLEIVGFNEHKRSLFERMGFHRRKLEAWPFFYKVQDKELACAVEPVKAWDPSLFEGDGSL